MIVSAQIRHCKNCNSMNLIKLEELESNEEILNVKIRAKCGDCEYIAQYPQISNITIVSQQ